MEQSYKEKYEQALERAKTLYENANGMILKKWVEQVFPELRETDDEKIRKEIIRFIRMEVEDEIVGNKWIAWLENIPVTIDHEKREGFHLGYKACHEEQSEQKPEENKGNLEGISPKWSVEDEENFCSVYLDVKSARQNTVNSLSGELKEQEQKRMDEVISWLRSLKGRVLPKQEWSEEDEQHIDSLLKRLDALCRNKFERTRFAISEDRDWLKSLRPQNRWKPSDEQMEALDWQVENTSVGSWQYKATKELMVDLKKLKEGKV